MQVTGDLCGVVQLIPRERDGEDGHAKVGRLEEAVETAVGYEETGLGVGEEIRLREPPHELDVGIL